MLRSVYECGDSFLARAICNRLIAAGIDAIVTGTDNPMAMSIGGAATNSMVKVEVADEDFTQARELLAADELRMRDATQWTCPRCDEVNAPAFDHCWSCNKSRERADEMAVVSTANPFVADESVAQEGVVEDGNPYRSPELAAPAKAAAGPLRKQDSYTDQIQRIWMASVMGCLIVPPLLNFYSLYLCCLLQSPATGQQQERKRGLHGKRFWIAIVLNVVSIVLWVSIYIRQFRNQ